MTHEKNPITNPMRALTAKERQLLRDLHAGATVKIEPQYKDRPIYYRVHLQGKKPYSIGTQTLNRLKDLALIETEDGLTYRLHD